MVSNKQKTNRAVKFYASPWDLRGDENKQQKKRNIAKSVWLCFFLNNYHELLPPLQTPRFLPPPLKKENVCGRCIYWSEEAELERSVFVFLLSYFAALAPVYWHKWLNRAYKHAMKHILLQIALYWEGWGNVVEVGKRAGLRVKRRALFPGMEAFGLGARYWRETKDRSRRCCCLSPTTSVSTTSFFLVHSAAATFPFSPSDEWQAQRLSPPATNWVRERSSSETRTSSSFFFQGWVGDTWTAGTLESG